MKLGYGLITCQRYPGDPRTPTDLYREALELARLCEDVGLDSVWTSEHHFWDDDYMPSLLVMSAAMAAVTTKIEIGTGVLLAPLYDPIRLAEDAATVDLISGGRFILGLGIGWRQEEFDRLGVPMEGLGRRMSETVRVLRRAWGPSTFTFEGDVYNYPPTNVTPKPSRRIPIWLGGFVDNAVRRAGRIADGYLGSLVAIDDVRRRVDLAKEGMARRVRQGGPGGVAAPLGTDPRAPEAANPPNQASARDFTFAIHEPVLVTADGSGGVEEFLPYVHNSRWKYDDMRQEFGRATDGPLPEPPAMDEKRKQALQSMLIAGDPSQVAARIHEFGEAAGEDLHFVARSYYPGVPFDQAKRLVELLGEVKSLL